MSNIVINLAAEFTGKKAFQQAGGATSKLESSVKKLGGAMAAAFSVQKIAQFGKDAVKAFIDDEKAAGRLATVVDNLGMSFANPAIAKFIDNLTLASGVSDTELRPAFQSLLTTTQSLSQSQSLLKDAIDISAGSGVDLTTVAQDLANAYVGNTKGLKKYNLGLTQAELKTASFEDIISRLNKQFNNSNAKLLDTYGGKVKLLSNAASEAQEILGKGLIDSLTILAGKDADVTDVASAFGDLSTSISETLVGVTTFWTTLRDFPIVSKLKEWVDAINPFVQQFKQLIDFFKNVGKKGKPTGQGNSTAENYRLDVIAREQRKKGKKITDDKLKGDKEIIKLQKEALAEQKKQAALKKAASMFDMEQIQLVAALKGNVSEEDRKRLSLQLALATGNVEEAKRLTLQLAISQGMTVALARDLASLPAANNPFAAWSGYLDAIELQAKRIAAFSAPGTTSTTAAAAAAAAVIAPVLVGTGTSQGGSVLENYRLNEIAKASAALQGGTGQGGSVAENYRLNQIVVQIDGKAVAAAVQDQSMNGISTTVDRTNGSFAW
jgi:hypothetical protein